MKEALKFHIEGMLEDGEAVPAAKSLNFYIENTNELSSDDILTHVEIATPELAVI